MGGTGPINPASGFTIGEAGRGESGGAGGGVATATATAAGAVGTGGMTGDGASTVSGAESGTVGEGSIAAGETALSARASRASSAARAVAATVGGAGFRSAVRTADGLARIEARRVVPACPISSALIAGAIAETFIRSGAFGRVAAGGRTAADWVMQPDNVARVRAIETAGRWRPVRFQSHRRVLSPWFLVQRRTDPATRLAPGGVGGAEGRLPPGDGSIPGGVMTSRVPGRPEGANPSVGTGRARASAGGCPSAT